MDLRGPAGEGNLDFTAADAYPTFFVVNNTSVGISPRARWKFAISILALNGVILLFRNE